MKRKLIAIVLVAMLMTVLMPTNIFAEAQPKRELNIVAVKASVVENLDTNAFSLWLEEHTGIKVNYTQITSESVAEKVAMMFAGNELPDAFIGVGFTDDMLLQYGSAGAIVPLDDYLQEHTPRLIEAMNYYDQGLTLLKQADGRTYSLPAINPCYHCTYANKLWMNMTWLNNLGLEVPTTIDEFTEVLRAFRDQDANGNGDPNDEVPLAGNPTDWYTQTYPFVINSFLYFDAVNKGFQLDDAGMIYNAMAKDEFRDAMRYLNMLYQEGLFYEGTLTQTPDQLKSMVENPNGNQVGATTAGYGGLFSAQIGDERYREYYAIPPLKGPQGVQFAMGRIQNPAIGRFVVTSACKDVELALEWADYFYDYAVTENMQNGPEGEYWRWATEGEYGMDGQPALWTAIKPYQGDTGEIQNHSWTEVGIYNFSAAWRAGQTVDTNVDLLSPEGMEFLLYKVTKEMYEPHGALEYCVPRLTFTEEQQSRLSILRYEFENYYDQVIFGFITGDMDINDDSAWQDHLTSLETYGLTELCSIYQAAYDTMYK